jgi:hypothetical protein
MRTQLVLFGVGILGVLADTLSRSAQWVYDKRGEIIRTEFYYPVGQCTPPERNERAN